MTNPPIIGQIDAVSNGFKSENNLSVAARHQTVSQLLSLTSLERDMVGASYRSLTNTSKKTTSVQSSESDSESEKISSYKNIERLESDGSYRREMAW